jgi:hypothetical protein
MLFGDIKSAKPKQTKRIERHVSHLPRLERGIEKRKRKRRQKIERSREMEIQID